MRGSGLEDPGKSFRVEGAIPKAAEMSWWRLFFFFFFFNGGYSFILGGGGEDCSRSSTLAETMKPFLHGWEQCMLRPSRLVKGPWSSTRAPRLGEGCLSLSLLVTAAPWTLLSTRTELSAGGGGGRWNKGTIFPGDRISLFGKLKAIFSGKKNWNEWKGFRKVFCVLNKISSHTTKLQ